MLHVKLFIEMESLEVQYRLLKNHNCPSVLGIGKTLEVTELAQD